MQDLLVKQDNLDSQVHRVQLAHQELMAHQEQTEILDPWELQA